MDNWRKLLWRLWIIATVPWILLWGLASLFSPLDFGIAASVGLGVPLVNLVLGRCIFWAMDGLKE